MDANVTHEYHRHKDYLERTFTTLKEKFAMDVSSHGSENMRVMHDNMTLIREINKQRLVSPPPHTPARARVRAHAAPCQIVSPQPTTNTAH